MRIDENEFVLRLYYVDAPESDKRFPERNAEQAAYFGITVAEALETGKDAKTFVYDQLAGKQFTIFTRWASALGSSKLPRYYAVVESEGRGLDELLIENGLARLHGTTVTHPNGTKPNDYLASLWQLQEKARANKLGAWAKSRPELQETAVEETEEVLWSTDRIVFFSLGAGSIGLLWITMSLLRRRSVH